MRFLPKTLSPRVRAAALFSVAAIAAIAFVVQTGLAARTIAFLDRAVEPEVLMVFAPLCALVLAITFEVTRFALRGNLPEGAPPRTTRPALSWSPGHREG